MGDGVLLYHETQESKLCAVHCLNAVLQGPYFSELELASIARDIDQTERDVMLEGSGGDAHSPDYLRFVAEASSNVALDGNFSIQVLQRALAALDLKCLPANSPELGGAATPVHAYICNLHEHWFALRQVAAEWYNFNSLLPAPQHLSGFYVSAFLDSLKNEGWSIFVVQGELPRDYNSAGGAVDDADAGGGGGGFGRWFTPQQAQQVLSAAAAAEEREKLAAESESALEESDPMLEAAIKASLRDLDQPDGKGRSREEDAEGDEGDGDEESDLAAAIAASLADLKPPPPPPY